MANKRQVRGRKAKVVVGDATIQPEFENTTLVHVLRVPRTDSTGAWMKSNRGSLLMDTLCFPVSATVQVKTRDKVDPSKWVLTVDDVDLSIADARALAIGTGSLKDTTTGLEYMVADAEGMDAMPKDVKTTIIRRCKRKTTITRLERVCLLVKSLADMQGVGDCFTPEEKEQLVNTPAKLLGALRDSLNKVKDTKKEEKFFSLA
jgi:hypothetical protein